MNKRTLLTITTTPLALLCSCQSTKKGDTRPNIIHIMTDDHSFQTISAYGHPLSKLVPTPNIDRLAKEGMLFTRGYVENSISTPSRACLMTGLYSHQNGQRDLGCIMDTTKTFFPEVLQREGYQTALFGKWHIHTDPKGFDDYKILYDQGMYYNPEFKSPNSNGEYIQEEGYATNLITDHAIEFLENRDKNSPFCMFVHHKAPHRNWMPDTKFVDALEEIEFPYPETLFDDYQTRSTAAHTQTMTIEKEMNLPYDLKVVEAENVQGVPEWCVNEMKNALERMTPEQREAWINSYKPKNEAFIAANLTGEELVKWKYQRYIKDYLRCIMSVDEQIGRLLDYLDQNGLTDNTMVVYTSDQGFYMGEHGWFDKRFMYEESYRTPIIMRYPNKIPAGTRCDELVQNIDFAPTYLAVAGTTERPEMAGLSLMPLFETGKVQNWREYLYYHYYDYPAIHSVRRHDGVSDKRYKLVHFYGGKTGKEPNQDQYELYDLQNDPAELNNIYGTNGTEAVTERLKNQLTKFHTDLKIDEF